MKKLFVLLMVLFPCIIAGIEKALHGDVRLNREMRRNKFTFAYNVPVACTIIAIAIIAIVTLLIAKQLALDGGRAAVTAGAYTAYKLSNKKLSEAQLVSLAEELGCCREEEERKFRKALRIAEHKARFRDYSVRHNYKECQYLRMIPAGNSAKIVVETSQKTTISKLPGYTKDAILTAEWKNLGFPMCPSKIILPSGRTYVHPRANQSHTKKGNSTYILEDLYRNGFANISEYREGYSIEKRNLLDEMSEYYCRSLWETDVKTKIDLRTKAFLAKQKFDAIQESPKLLNGKVPVSRANQVAAGLGNAALAASRDAMRGMRLTPENICFLPDKTRDVLFDGLKLSFEADSNGRISFLLKAVKRMTNKTTDGAAFMPLSLAKALGVSSRVIAFQARPWKGMITIVPDEWFEKLPEMCKDIFEHDVDPRGKIVMFASMAKDWQKYKRAEDLLAAYEGRLCYMDGHVDYGPEVTLSRQTYQALMWAANKSLIRRSLRRYFAQMDAMRTEEGVIAKMKAMSPITRLAPFDKLLRSSIMANAFAKEMWYNHIGAQAGEIPVRGCSLYAVPEIKAVLGFNPSVKPGECLVPKETGLRIGQRVVVTRYPYLNPEPTILTIVGYTNVPGIIEFSIDDIVMIKLDMDFDGDHVTVIAEESVVEAAELALEMCKKCDARTLTFEDMKASEAAAAQSIEEYLTKAAYMSDVGQATSPVFLLYALIPIGATPETIVTIGDQAWTVAEILRTIQLIKVDVTLTADAAKRGAESPLQQHPLIKKVNDLKKDFVPFSEYFAHPTDCEFTEEGLLKKDRWGDDADGKEVVYSDTACSWFTVLRELITEHLYGEANAWTPRYVDVYADKATYVDGELTKTYGWVKVIQDPEYTGIAPSIWKQKIGVEELDNREAPLNIFFDTFEEGERVFVGDGKYVDGKDFKEFCLNGVPEATIDTPDDLRKYAVNCYRYADGTYTIGLFLHRMFRAQQLYEWEQKHDDRRTKKTIRIVTEQHMLSVVQGVVFHIYGVEITKEQAKLVLFNESAAYLFGKDASEVGNADLQWLYQNNEQLIRKISSGYTK